ncbi:MAG: hypothetical protein V1755_11815 [Chloroflexota bacterium]
MNHQPFENWLLDDEPLTIQQERELQMHLRGCTACAGIADSNLALHSRRLVTPPPGFTDRFRPRLADWRREQLRRQALGTIVLVVAGLALLYALAWPAILDAMRSPAAWLGLITAYLVGMFTFLSVFAQVGSILLRNLPDIVPPAAWFAMFVAGCVLGSLWIVTMRRLARAPQGV